MSQTGTHRIVIIIPTETREPGKVRYACVNAEEFAGGHTRRRVGVLTPSTTQRVLNDIRFMSYWSYHREGKLLREVPRIWEGFSNDFMRNLPPFVPVFALIFRSFVLGSQHTDFKTVFFFRTAKSWSFLFFYQILATMKLQCGNLIVAVPQALKMIVWL